MDELISIIVPVYNVEQYLDACLMSILKQTYNNIEIILVDDGSTDRSGKKCDEYAEKDSRIKVIHKENGGLSDARNKGISVSNGSYIMFLDSDDIVSSNIVDYLYRVHEETLADIVICDSVHCYPDKKIIFEEENQRTIFKPEEAIAEMLYQRSFLVSAWGKLFRRDVFDDILFPYGMLFEDSAVMYKIFDHANKIAYGNARLYGYMHREGSITTKKFSKKDCDILVICQQITEYMSNRNVKLQAAARSYYTAAAFRVYLNAPRNGEFEKEIKESEKILNENSWLVMKDSFVRRKIKAALIIYTFCKPIMPFIYKRIDRWK